MAAASELDSLSLGLSVGASEWSREYAQRVARESELQWRLLLLLLRVRIYVPRSGLRSAADHSARRALRSVWRRSAH